MKDCTCHTEFKCFNLVDNFDGEDDGGEFSFIEGNDYTYSIDTHDYWETTFTVIDDVTGFSFPFNEVSFNLHFKTK